MLKTERGGEQDNIEEEEEDAEEVHEVPEPVTNRRKQKDFEVFVGGLDRDAVEEDVEKAFKDVGEVMEVRLVKKAHSQRNKGFAFVRFATVEQAKRAVTEIKSVRVWHFFGCISFFFFLLASCIVDASICLVHLIIHLVSVTALVLNIFAT